MSDFDVESARAAFFGKDPVAGDDAVNWFVETYAERAVYQVITVPPASSNTLQISRRLAQLTKSAGASALPHLIETIQSRDWGASGLAAAAFAGLRGNSEAEAELIRVLKGGMDIDSQRRAIEALGYLGAAGWGFSLVEFAQFEEWGASVEHRQPSPYLLGKFNFHVFQTLLRMTQGLSEGDRIRSLLDSFKRLRKVCRQVLHRDLPDDWDVRGVVHHFGTAAADPLIKEWLADTDLFLQEQGFEALSHLRLERTVPLFINSANTEHLNPRVRAAADVGLSSFCSRSAATHLARSIVPEQPTHLRWAFSTLYAVEAPWPNCDHLIDSILESGGEPKLQLIHALAWRGDERARSAEDGLNAKADYERGISALSLARLDPTAARGQLSGREAEAASPLERAELLAAQINVGMTELVDQLHCTLQEVPMFPYLRSVWKREILAPFFVAEGPQSRRGKLWCEAAFETDTRVKSEIAALQGNKPTPVRIAAAVSMPTPLVSPAASNSPADSRRDQSHRFDLFISHASEDKEAIARPLYNALHSVGLRIWFDEATLQLGDSLRRKIDEGLAHSRFGVVILSPRFLEKEWPQRELDGLTARETSSGRKTILPVWHEVDGAMIMRYSPTLADRLACRTSEGLEAVVRKIKEALGAE